MNFPMRNNQHNQKEFRLATLKVMAIEFLNFQQKSARLPTDIF